MVILDCKAGACEPKCRIVDAAVRSCFHGIYQRICLFICSGYTQVYYQSVETVDTRHSTFCKQLPLIHTQLIFLYSDVVQQFPVVTK